MRTEAVGQFLDLRNALVTAFFDDVGGTELAGQSLPVGVAGHGDDPVGTHLLRRQDTEKPDGAVADHGDSLTGPNLSRLGGEPSGPEDVGRCKERRNLVGVGHFRSGHQRAVREGDAQNLGLGAADALAVDAAALVAGQADLAGVVRGEEGSNDELAHLDVLHVGANFFNDADILMTHRHGFVKLVRPAVGPKVGPAHAGRDNFDEGVSSLLDGGPVTVLDADVAGGHA